MIVVSTARPPLTAREAAVLRLLCQGFRQKEIAVSLGLSRRRVEAVLFQLRRKSGTDTNPAMVARFRGRPS